MARYDNILQTIGNTPLVRINKLAPEGINLFAKVESFNPMGSVKDRMARAVIEHAERTGALTPGQTVIEATSGNTGIGLAMVCAQKGYPLIVTMAENFSIERRKMLRFLGARVILTPASEKGTGMLNKAIELANAHGYFLCRQFENEANAEIHYTTTAREILNDFAGERIDYWVSGFGTGGTLLGCARALKEADQETRIVVAEPDNARLLGSGVAQLRDDNGAPSASHPEFRPHLMQGWSPDFVSLLAERAEGEGLIDEYETVSGMDAMHYARELATSEGIFAGTSGGATMAAAIAVARRSAPGSNIICMLPDTGERYLSTPLFEHIGESMSVEEQTISRSTANYRFDLPSNVVTVGAAPAMDTELASARAFVDEIISGEPVVMFALQWCEFCWAIRKLFSRLGIAYRSIDLDSVSFLQDKHAGQVRAALAEKTGRSTIPQVYIDRELVGGCSDVFDAFTDGTLGKLLERGGIGYRRNIHFDPYALLPTWLHPRQSA
jgi:cysteine synthase